MKIQKYLEQSPLFTIQLAYENIVTPLNQDLKKEKLNLLRALVLTTLFFEEREDITPSQLSELFSTTRGNMSHILSHLEYQGWVKRSVKETDARKFHIGLKPEGRKKAIALIKLFDRLQAHFEEEVGMNRNQKAIEDVRTWIICFKNSRSK